jgi:glycerol-3-phosphate dehydrogenase
MAGLIARHPFLTRDWAQRLVRAYGTEAEALLGGARQAGDLGRGFGATLTEAELDWMAGREWAQTAEDALWRRSKLALRLDAAQVQAVEDWFAARHPGATRPAGTLSSA